MTMIKAIRFLQLLSYFVVAGQLMYYFFLMGDALKAVGIENFIEQRKIVDPMVHQRHVPVYYACLVLSIAVVLLTLRTWNSPLFLSAVFALLCLLIDILLAQKQSMPVNMMVNTQHFDEHGIDWEGLRTRWISSIQLRGAISMAGFVALLSGLFWTKS